MSSFSVPPLKRGHPLRIWSHDGLFSGAHVAGKDGAYVLKAGPSDESRANSPEFAVATINPEDRETGARPDLAKEIAEISGGKELNQQALSGFKDDFNSENPRDNEVLVKVKGAGLCHSDLSVINGSRIMPLPLVIGHEGSGEVVETGN